MTFARSSTRTIEVRGSAFRVTASSHPGGAPAFLLVHGIGISSRAFARLHRVLAADATVYSVDLPGFGGLPAPDRSPDVPAMAALLANVVRMETAEPVIAVGNSMGTQWVVELARQHPELVSRVVVIGPVADDTRRSAVAQGLALLIDSTRESPSANALVLRDYLRCGPRWYFRQLPHMLDYRIEDSVAELERPLLIIRGERDPIARAGWCERLREAAADAQLAQIPRQPHLAQHTAPREVAREIRRFVGGGGRWG